MYGPLIVHRLIKLWPRSRTQMSNPQDIEGEPLCCTHMWESALASGALAFIHEMGEITPVWDKTVKWAGYEVRGGSQNSIMPNSHLLARKIRGVWIAHRCVFLFSTRERVILHNPIQLLYCVYSGTVTNIRAYMTCTEHVPPNSRNRSRHYLRKRYVCLTHWLILTLSLNSSSIKGQSTNTNKSYVVMWEQNKSDLIVLIQPRLTSSSLQYKTNSAAYSGSLLQDSCFNMSQLETVRNF